MKYPVILKSKSESDTRIMLAYNKNEAARISSEPIDLFGGFNFDTSDAWENITREYLAGSWVEIKSESHGSLIQDIAFKAGYRWRNAGKEKQLYSTGYIKFNECKAIMSLSPIPLSEHKEITIPLPPKDDLTAGPGLTLTGGTLDVDLAKKPEPKEWPQVGEEVAWSPKLSRKGTLLNIYEGMAWIKDSYGEFVSIEVNKLKKPPTTEEYLKEQLFQHSGVRARDGGREVASYLAKAIINGEIKYLSYKPE